MGYLLSIGLSWLFWKLALAIVIFDILDKVIMKFKIIGTIISIFTLLAFDVSVFIFLLNYYFEMFYCVLACFVSIILGVIFMR